MSIASVMPSNHLILCCPLLLPPSIFPSFRVFSNESVLHITWPEYWSFSFNISTSNEYSGLISFTMDWLDLFPVQGTLKSLFQHHSSKASILRLCIISSFTALHVIKSTEHQNFSLRELKRIWCSLVTCLIASEELDVQPRCTDYKPCAISQHLYEHESIHSSGEAEKWKEQAKMDTLVGRRSSYFA